MHRQSNRFSQCKDEIQILKKVWSLNWKVFVFSSERDCSTCTPPIPCDFLFWLCHQNQKNQYKNLGGATFVHPPEPLEMSQSGFTAGGMGEAGRFLRMPSPEHWKGWVECDHSVTTFPEWGLCTSTCSTKQNLTFLYTQQIPFILFFFPVSIETKWFLFLKKKNKGLDLKSLSAEVLYLPSFRSAANPNMIYQKSLLLKGIVATEIMNYLKVTFNLLPKKQASIAQGCWGNRKAASDQFAAEKTRWYFAICTYPP